MITNDELKQIQETLKMTAAQFAEALGMSEISVKKYRSGENQVPESRLNAARLLLMEHQLTGGMKIERDIVRLVRLALDMHNETLELIHDPERYKFQLGEIEISYRTGFIAVSCSNEKNRLAKTLRAMAQGWKMGQVGR